MILKKAKEWWLRMAELEGDLPVGAGLSHSSNGCCNPDCEVCSGAPCHSPLCEICYPESNYFARSQTGFDKYLEEMLESPVFREEYEKARKEIDQHDRKQKEAMEQAPKSHRPVGGTSQGSKNKKRVGRSKKGKKR